MLEELQPFSRYEVQVWARSEAGRGLVSEGSGTTLPKGRRQGRGRREAEGRGGQGEAGVGWGGRCECGVRQGEGWSATVLPTGRRGRVGREGGGGGGEAPHWLKVQDRESQNFQNFPATEGFARIFRSGLGLKKQ